MPISVTKHPSPPQPPQPIVPSALPEEIYVKLEFDSHSAAQRWCEDVVATLTRPLSEGNPFNRVVLWSPGENGRAAYLSILAMRIVRAEGGRYMPARELVTMGQLPAGLGMLIGSTADLHAYRQAHA